MPTKAKVDDSILLELVQKGLKQSEIARYFDVRPSSIRSKLLSLSKKDPAYSQAINQKNDALTDQNASLSNRLDSYAIKMFSDAGNVLKRLQVTPIPDDIPGMILRSDLQLKGLQIVERIQKILGMSQGEGPKAIQVNQITNYLGNKSMTSNTSDESQVIDAEQVWRPIFILWQRMKGGGGRSKNKLGKICRPQAPLLASDISIYGPWEIPRFWRTLFDISSQTARTNPWTTTQCPV